MKTTHRLTLAGAFVVLSGVASLLAAPELSDPLVTHWNAAGEPDGTMSKTLGLAFVPRPLGGAGCAPRSGPSHRPAR